MSLVINHNLMAMNAARNLGTAYGALSTSTQRLSSGLRVNTAADDAAGLAIRELMRADIKSLNQGVRNANDAISMIQTADGALGVIDEKLIRLKELAMQASTGTYSSDQRLMIDSEYQAMCSEITRIAMATDFNGIHLLNGHLSGDATTHNGTGIESVGALKIHFGTGNDCSEDYYYINVGNCTASALGLGMLCGSKNKYTAEEIAAETDAATKAKMIAENNAGKTISTQELAQQALEAINQAIISKDKIRASLGAMQNRLENTITNLSIQAENLQASESRISDVDVATEMTEYTRQQILAQSAVAMLAQANSLPKMALQLIQG
jgi:flagellin